MNPAHSQATASVRFDWALTGAIAISDAAEVAVLVDVLSFTTAVTVAVEAGTLVLPWRWAERAAAEPYARQHDAVLAVGRSHITPGQVSLSPASMRRTELPAPLVFPPTDRLSPPMSWPTGLLPAWRHPCATLMPSPTGSALATHRGPWASQ